jgi:hypothetical protein
MVDAVILGGVAVALAGMVGVSAWRQGRLTSAATLIRDAMANAHGPEAEALRPEFRRSGVIPPEPRGRPSFL